MCGIAGFVGYTNAVELAEKANDVQRHRGPDHQGRWSDGRIALAHQRLAIIDLSERSNQPLEKGGSVIIFNGEIYNYRQLRRDLQEQGVLFETESDTEVVLEMYRNFGEQCLQQLIGMFAFAIYEKSSGEIFLARDHFGIKPLFYMSKGEKFAFASELKTLVATGVTDRQINYKSLVSSLNYLWVSGNETMFIDCSKLPPSHFMRVTASGSISLSQYQYIDQPLFILNDGGHQRITNKVKQKISSGEIQKRLKQLDKHSDYLGKYWRNYHESCLYLGYIGDQNEKFKFLIHATTIYGINVTLHVLLRKVLKNMRIKLNKKQLTPEYPEIYGML